MKTRTKYFFVSYATDLYFYEDENAIICAESAEEAERAMRDSLGEHLLAVYVRPATWRERRAYKKEIDRLRTA